jgi:hypothetical protein
VGVTSLLPLFMGNIITDKLQVRTNMTVAALINNVTLPLDFHSAVEFTEGMGAKLLLISATEFAAYEIMGTIYFFRCWDFLVIRVQLD